MPLDDGTRARLEVLLRRVSRILQFGQHPIEAYLSWLREPTGPRRKRRVHLNADGDVLSTEDMSPKESGRE